MKTETMMIATAAIVSATLLSPVASAAITISQQTAAAPTYGNTLNFDEPGTPVGLVPDTTWLASDGIQIFDSVNGPNTVIEGPNENYPWVGTGNFNTGTFGINLVFSQDISSLSLQVWDPSGAPSPFGGGLVVALYDAANNLVGSGSYTGAWGGIGKTWFNITTTGGSSFRSAAFFNNSFDSVTFCDNLSWNTVPGPGSLALIGLAGLVGRGRRRA